MDEKEWLLCETRIWKGKGFKFYKLDNDNELYVSTDLVDWERTEEIWHDINSRKYKLDGNQLYMSLNGKSWEKQEKCFWQSPGGSYYFFDENLKLYKKKWF